MGLAMLLCAAPARAQDPPPVHVSGRSAPPLACVAPGGRHAASFWIDGDAVLLFDLETLRDYASVRTDGAIHRVYFAARGQRLIVVTETGFEVHDLSGRRLQRWQKGDPTAADTAADGALEFRMATHAAVSARTVRHGGETRLVVERADGPVVVERAGPGLRLSASGERVWWSAGRTIHLHDTRTGASVATFEIATNAASQADDVLSGLLEVSRDDRAFVLPELAARDGEQVVASIRWHEGGERIAEWTVPAGAELENYFFAADGSLAIAVDTSEGPTSMLRWRAKDGPPVAVDWPALAPFAIDFDSGICVTVPMPGQGQLSIGTLVPARTVSTIASMLPGSQWLVDAASGDLCDFDGALLHRWDLAAGQRRVVGRQWLDSLVAVAGSVMLVRDGLAVALAGEGVSAREELPGLVANAQIAVDEGMRHVAVADHERFWTASITDDSFAEPRAWPRPVRPAGSAEPIHGALRCLHVGAGTWCVADDLGRVELWTSHGECTPLGTFPELVAPPVPEFGSQKPAVMAGGRRAGGGVWLLAAGTLWQIEPTGKALQRGWSGTEPVDAGAFASDGTIALACADEIVLLDGNGAELGRLVAPHDEWRELRFARGGAQLLCTTTGVATLWKLPSREGPFTLVPVRDGTAAIVGPSGTWIAPRSALAALTVRVGDRGCPAESFDAIRNRPDIVLAELGVADAAAIQRAAGRVQARWAELGLKPDATVVSRPPVLNWVERPPRATAAGEVAMRVRAVPGTAPLRSWRVFADNVPVGELAGRPVAKGDGDEAEFVVPLRHGSNRIRVEVVDTAGLRASPLQFELIREGPAPEPRLFVLGVGVSDYRDDAHDLRYAASDVTRLAEQLQIAWPGACRVLPLRDGQADRAGILAARTFVQEAGIDDVVLVFFAGHGLIAEDGNYVFAGHDFDFARPGATGVRLGEIEALLHATPARRRLVLLDTCRAGRPRPEQVVEVALTPQRAAQPPSASAVEGSGLGTAPTARLRTRGIDPETSSGSPVVAEDPMQAMADLGDGVGATMLAAAGSAEYALEIGSLRGGLFTTAVCEGLGFLAADLDHDLQITVAEWMRAAQRQVIAWSKGAQVPGLRRDNLQFDVVMARATSAVAWGDSLDDFVAQDWAVSDDGDSVLLFGENGALLRTRPDGAVRWRIAGPESGYYSGEFLRDGTIALSASEPKLTFVDSKDGSVLATSDLFCFTPRSPGCDGAEASVFAAAMFGKELDVWRGGKLRRIALGSLFDGGLKVVDVLFAREGPSATLLGMSGELVQWNFADDSRRFVGRVRLPDGLAPNGEPLANRLSPTGRYVLGDRDENGGGRLFVWTAEDGKLVADRRVPTGRLAVVLPDGLVEMHVGDREIGVDPLQVLDPIAGTTSFERWFADLDHASGVLEVPDAWVQPAGAGGFVFVRPPDDAAEDFSASPEESMLVFDARSGERLAWLRMVAKEREPGSGDEGISSLDLVGTARVVASRGVVVWVTRNGRVFEWSLAAR